MIELLCEERLLAGLEFNAKKSRMFTLEESNEQREERLLIDVADDFIEVMRGREVHKYLGNAYPGSLKNRGKTILSNRLRCAWSKFNLFRHSLFDRHVDVKLRLKLFDSVVSPSACYGLTTAPLTKADLEELDVVQRKMLRRIVGYVVRNGDEWDDFHRRMRCKMDGALSRHPISAWSCVLTARKQKLADKLAAGSCPALVQRVFQWDPHCSADPKLTQVPSRTRGRPRCTWASAIE